MNLLKETLDDLAEHGHTAEDVLWVGSEDGKLVVTWEQFVKTADLEYDSGFGSQEIASDLVVVGADWWLSRTEYDGSEHWQYNTMPVKYHLSEEFHTVKDGSMWEKLRHMNRKEEVTK